MSYDVSIGGEDFNYTSNVSEMFYKHFPNGEGLRGLDGMTGRQACTEFSALWRSLNTERINRGTDGEVGEPGLCKLYDSPNGWGSTVGAIIFLASINAACASHPRHRVSVWA